MVITERHTAATQPTRPVSNARINQIRRHERDMGLSTRPAKTHSFFSTTWNWISNFLSRRKSPATPKTSAAACGSLLKTKTCEEIRNGYFNALYRKEFKNDLDLSPTEFVSLQQDYDGKHADLRKEILKNPEFLEKFKALPEAARFYLAEAKAHERQLYADAYPPMLMSRLERVVEKLEGVLIQSFGITPGDIAADREIRDSKATKLAFDCFSEIRDAVPKNMRLRIPPAARMIYCDAFYDAHVKLRQGIWEDRFSDQYVAVFAHKRAMNAIAEKLPDPSGGATNPDGLAQREIWMANMRTAALEFLGFTGKDDEQEYAARLSGADRILLPDEVAVLRSALNSAKRNAADYPIPVAPPTRYPQILGQASPSFAKMKAALPKKIQSRMPPTAKEIYCKTFHGCYSRLRDGIAEMRLPDTFVKRFAHYIALEKSLNLSAQPSREAANRNSAEQLPILAKKMHAAACKYLGFGKENQQAYERTFFGNGIGNARDWSQAEKALLRGEYSERACDGISMETIQTSRMQNGYHSSPDLSDARRKQFDKIYDSVHLTIRSELLLKCKIDNRNADAPSVFYWADTIAHRQMSQVCAPLLPEAYLASMQSVAKINAALLADRLFISSDFIRSFHFGNQTPRM